MVSSFTLGWSVALAFAIGAAAGRSIELLLRRKQDVALRAVVLRQRELLRQQSLDEGLRRSEW